MWWIPIRYLILYRYGGIELEKTNLRYGFSNLYVRMYIKQKLDKTFLNTGAESTDFLVRILITFLYPLYLDKISALSYFCLLIMRLLYQAGRSGETPSSSAQSPSSSWATSTPSDSERSTRDQSSSPTITCASGPRY